MTIEKATTGDAARLDDAIRKGDAMFKSSLKREEEQRKRQTLQWAAIIVGGLLAIGLIANAVLLMSRRSATVVQQSVPAAQSSPASADELNEQGWALWKQGNMASAARKFEQAVALDPKQEAAWNGLGWAKFNGGDAAAGAKAFEKLLAMNPDHPAALNGLGQIHVLSAEPDKAEPILLKAAPQAPAAWWGLVRVYLLKGNYAEARKWGQKILDSGDKSIQPYLDAAKAEKVDDQLRQEMTPLRRK